VRIPILALAIGLFVSCIGEFKAHGLTNDEIIKEVKKCEDAGLRPQMLANVWALDVTKVQCIIKEDRKK